MARTKGETNFINEMARQHLVTWADAQILGKTPDVKGLEVYVEHAVKKGWLSKKDRQTVTSTGFTTAGAYLRR